MSNRNAMIIAMSDIEREIDKEAPVKERLIQAMIQAQNHWLVIDEDAQFRSAIGAVMATVSPEEKQIIEEELDFLTGLASAVSGVPIDVLTLLERRPENAYGIKSLWMEAKEAAK